MSMSSLDSIIPSINSRVFSTIPSTLRYRPIYKSTVTSFHLLTSDTYSSQLSPKILASSAFASEQPPKKPSMSCLGKLGSAPIDLTKFLSGDWHLLMFEQQIHLCQSPQYKHSKIVMQTAQTVQVEIECPVSRSTITRKCFTFAKGRRLADLRDILMTVFELEGFLAQFRFYHGRQQIQTLRDIQQPTEKRYYITLQLQFQGG